MLVIALDTSTPAVTAGLVALDGGGPRPLAQRVTVNARAHGELLTPHLMAAVAEAGHRLADADAIVVGSGPGPFTGLRAGMVTAAALGQALDVPVHPVCSLDAIAAAVPDGAAGQGVVADIGEPGAAVSGASAGGLRLLVATDARRKEVYWAAYGTDRERLTGPHVHRPEDVPAEIDGLDLDFAVGEMAAPHRETFGLDVLGTEYPTPTGLVAAARHDLQSGAEPTPPVPMYLRRPDATAPGPRKQVSPDDRRGTA
ncbi:tRNA (adenosine(37)-N6)-threonylcarbamoyltransferase complex dimerization subunit type 1 TsaB [Saccharopolyspora sp. NFXS83]|uniref:tRNA (adenosine(37)-N6)-threonylcarbamoyltransferase complex dimerization subunit type 1 TsaB n=1 Tax=Saccharopolyspora sp. NFXS83 TaxID=2993560 RepID=UPI00224A622C|nr:tRNA (adenosine(37)-N6)-threonylcarbamoyltransferase complex dimerization subunit type 1 TsaB [Saccharopolyspora sp. NFXS83]MCX2734417.1 tRNA (adenosine(37)-N6)-threonylcarbamoyltransferase complex dimerization subunit type 1 TsaB [Saccharopolyspora sp. NFXS83]